MRSFLPTAVMIILILGNGWLQCAYGDLHEENNGLGNDGWWYGQFARELPKWLWPDDPNDETHKIPYERLQRILPSAVVWATFQFLGVAEPSDEQIVLAFRLLNAFCLAVSVLLWHSIGNCLELRSPGRWFGFLAIFGSCAYAKWLWYYPVLTDVPTLPLAMLMLLAFLRRSLIGLAIVSVVGSFVCSALSLWSMPLFLCLTTVRPRPTDATERWKVNLATIVCVSVGVAAMVHMQYFTNFPNFGFAFPTQKEMLPLSILAAAAYLWYAGNPLLAWTPFVRPWLLARAFFTPGVAVWIGVSTLIKCICELLVPGSSSQTTAATFGFVFGESFSIFARGTVAPLWFLVAHTIYFGPIILVLMLRWRSLCGRFGEQGVGMLLFVGLAVLLGLDSETRHLYVALPFLVAFAAKEIEELRPGRIFWVSFVGLTGAFSTAWLAIRHVWYVWHDQPPRLEHQFYSNFVGPFSSYEVYGQFSVLALVAFWILWLSLRLPRASAALRQAPFTSVSPGEPDWKR